jgi:integrase
VGVFPRNGNWYISFFCQGRRIRQKVGPSKTLALNALKKREIEVAEEKFLDIKRQERIPFKEFAQEYLEKYAKPNKRAWASTDTVFINHFTAFVGTKALHEITPHDIERYKSERLKSKKGSYKKGKSDEEKPRSISVSTVNRELSWLRSVFNRAIDWGKLEHNPLKKVKFFKENNQRVRYLEREELESLLQNSSSRLKSVITFAINTGLRKSEIQNLKWSDVNFHEGYIGVHGTKNGESRYCPMNQDARNALLLFRKHPKSPYIFCGKDGEPYNFRKSFETALGKSGILNFRFHDLRHTFASYLAQRGVDLNTIRELLGHKSLDMTLRYSHLSKDHKTRAVALLEQPAPKVSPEGMLTEELESLEFVTHLAATN